MAQSPKFNLDDVDTILRQALERINSLSDQLSTTKRALNGAKKDYNILEALTRSKDESKVESKISDDQLFRSALKAQVSMVQSRDFAWEESLAATQDKEELQEMMFMLFKDFMSVTNQLKELCPAQGSLLRDTIGGMEAQLLYKWHKQYKSKDGAQCIQEMIEWYKNKDLSRRIQVQLKKMNKNEKNVCNNHSDTDNDESTS